MAGLLDAFMSGQYSPDQDKNDAIRQGLLAAGFGLLNSRGNFGQALGQAGQQGLNQFQQQREAQQQQKMREQALKMQELQMAEMARNSQRQQQLQSLPGQFNLGGLTPGQQGPRGFDFNGYAEALAGIDPMAALQLQGSLQKDNSPIITKSGDVARDRRDPSKVLWENVAADSVPGSLKEYQYAVKNDGYKGTFEQWRLAEKKAGASSSNVSVKVENALGEGVAKQVGPMVEASYAAANGAQSSISNSDNVIKAIDSGKVIAGPAASLRLAFAQGLDVLGVGGKDTKEKIANTRAAIQGLSQSILSARQQLKGQGQVSDFEGKLLAKATAGELDDLTVSEIRQLAVLNKKLSNQVIAQHKQLTTKLRSRESTANLADLFEVNPGAPEANSAPMRFDAQGNPIK